MWSAYLFKTVSGALGPRIFPHSVSWNITINEIETMDFTLEKSAMPKLASNLWIEPWWAGVVFMYDGVPIIAGPIVSRPIETSKSIRFMAHGPRALFAKRQALRDMDSWSNLKNANIEKWTSYGDSKNPANNLYRAKTYPSLIRMAIEQSMTKHGGDLPIVFKVPILTQTPADPTVDPDTGDPIPYEDQPHSLHVGGMELAEATVEAQIDKLINVEDGPDIFFKPTLTSRYSLQWEFWSGRTDSDNELPNYSDTIWDTTAQSGFISDLSVNYVGTSMTNRAFVRGSGGSGGGQTIRMSDNPAKRNADYPLLESYETISEDGSNAVQARANETRREHDKASHQINATVRANGPQKLGTFWPGEYARLITSGWYALRNGETRAKILSMSGDFSNNIDISFKETEVL